MAQDPIGSINSYVTKLNGIIQTMNEHQRILKERSSKRDTLMQNKQATSVNIRFEWRDREQMIESSVDITMPGHARALENEKIKTICMKLLTDGIKVNLDQIEILGRQIAELPSLDK